MPEFKIFEGDDTGWVSLMAYMLYPYDEGKRAGYYASNVQARIADLAKLRRLSSGRTKQETFNVFDISDAEKTQKQVHDILSICSDKQINQFSNNLETECFDPIKGQEALIKAPSMDKYQKEIDKGFFKWLALGTVVRLIADFYFLYQEKICTKKPSRERIFKLAQKHPSLKHLLLCYTSKSLDIEWQKNYASLHLYAAFARIIIPDYKTLFLLEEYGCLILTSPTDKRKYDTNIKEWRKQIEKQLMEIGIINFLSLARAYQNFSCFYKSPCRINNLLDKNKIHYISNDLSDIPQSDIGIDRPPQEFINSYNRIP